MSEFNLRKRLILLLFLLSKQTNQAELPERKIKEKKVLLKKKTDSLYE